MSLLIDPYRFASFNPLTAMSWSAAYWASDPLWSNPGDGNTVTSWRDGSGNGNTLTNTLGSPKYRAASSSLNNQPAIDLTTADMLGNNSYSLAQPWSIVVISLMRTGGGGNDYLIGGGVVSAWAIYKNTNWTLFAGSDGPTRSFDTTAAHMIRGYANGASSVLDRDGSVSATANPNSRPISALSVSGRADDLAGVRATGLYSFIGVYSGDVSSDTQWSAFKTWAASTYGITIA